MASPARDARQAMEARGYSVKERGRGYLVMQKGREESLDTQVGGRGWHRLDGTEVDTAWVQSGPNYRMDLGDGYQAEVSPAQNSYKYEGEGHSEWVRLFAESALRWENDSGDSESAVSLNSPTTSVVDDIISFDGLFGSGSRLDIEAQTARLAKRLHLEAGVLSTPTIGGTINLCFDLRFQRSNNSALWIDGVEWNEASDNPVETSDHIEFKDGEGNTLFYFKRPWAKDFNGSHQDGSMYCRKTGANLWVEVRIPYTWIDSAVYPIVIDPTIDPTIGDGNDDGYWDSSLVRGLDYTILGDWAGGLQSTFHLFAISGPSGATCTTAYVTFTAWTNDSGTTLNAYVAADDSNSPSAYTTVSAASSATETTTTVSWTPGAWTQNATTNAVTPEIKTIIQELWDSGFGETGENIIIRIRDNTSDSGAQRIAWAYDGDTSKDAVLHAEYTTASTIVPIGIFQSRGGWFTTFPALVGDGAVSEAPLSVSISKDNLSRWRQGVKIVG